MNKQIFHYHFTLHVQSYTQYLFSLKGKTSEFIQPSNFQATTLSKRNITRNIFKKGPNGPELIWYFGT